MTLLAVPGWRDVAVGAVAGGPVPAVAAAEDGGARAAAEAGAAAQWGPLRLEAGGGMKAGT